MRRMKNAFTLAEVLITLSIIGIVAAIVMPNLMSSYQYKTVGVKLAKFMSTTEAAARAFMVNEGNLTSKNAADFLNDSYVFTSFEPKTNPDNNNSAIIGFPSFEKSSSNSTLAKLATSWKGSGANPIAYLKDGTAVKAFYDTTAYGTEKVDTADGTTTSSITRKDAVAVERYGVPVLRLEFNPRVQGMPSTAQTVYNVTVTELGYVFPSPKDDCVWQLYSENYQTSSRSFADGKACHVSPTSKS